MSNLVKATLQKVLADEAETPDGDAFPVQFNPASLRIRLTNQIEGGRSNAKQVRQQTGNSSRTLSLELIFDTADEGSTESPISVRNKTKQLEQFISTPKNNPDPPPKLKFQWGDLTVVGIADSIDVSLEHFATNGYPLRAKVSFSIKEQDPTIVFKPADRGTSGAKSPGENAGTPGAGTNSGFAAGISLGAGFGAGFGISAGFGVSGGVGLSAGTKVGLALEGEMGAEFAARMGGDPTAWRGLETGASNPSSLGAGSQIAFNVGIGSSPGVGVKNGVNTQTDVNHTAASGLGLSSSEQSTGALLDTLFDTLPGSPSGAKSNGDSVGKAMSSLGGIGATINAVKFKVAQQQTNSSVAAFGMDLGVLVATSFNGKTLSDAASQTQSISRAPLVRVHQQGTITPADVSQGLSSFLDERSMTYGQGIPLDPLFGVSQAQRIFKVYAERNQAFEQPSQNDVPFSANATTPSWLALQQRDSVRQSIDHQSYNALFTLKSHACRCTGANK